MKTWKLIFRWQMHVIKKSDVAYIDWTHNQSIIYTTSDIYNDDDIKDALHDVIKDITDHM